MKPRQPKRRSERTPEGVANESSAAMAEAQANLRVTPDVRSTKTSAEDRQRQSAVEPTRYQVKFPDGALDPDALRVVRKLNAAGFEAYLVGGAVRDLLVGRKAKDFDIATSARPEDVKRVFRQNCRIIGRRFRLAHVFFGYGNRTYEVATFRRNPVGLDEGDDETKSDLLIRSDNVFGTAEEDAERRDFTINALFYDQERSEILDWTLGMPDLERRVVRTIGDPDVRFREDPIRILRAIKFAARLDFGIDPDVYDAIVAHREELGRSSPPRVFEEILRLLRGGAARRSMYLAWDTGALAVVLPELSALFDDAEHSDASTRVFRALKEIDRITAERSAPPDDAVLLAALLREPVREWTEGVRSREAWRNAMEERLSEIGERLSITRRLAEQLGRLYTAEAKLASGRIGGFMDTSLGALAKDLTRIGLVSDRAKLEKIEWVKNLPVRDEKAARESWSEPVGTPHANGEERVRPNRESSGSREGRPGRTTRTVRF